MKLQALIAYRLIVLIVLGSGVMAVKALGYQVVWLTQAVDRYTDRVTETMRPTICVPLPTQPEDEPVVDDDAGTDGTVQM